MITESVPLRDIAYARSGDKGAHANVGIIAYTKEGYEFLEKHLTTEKVHAFFTPLGVKETLRFEMPNLIALNFLLKGILSGNDGHTLRVDNQGKALGQALLEMKISVPEKLLCRCRKP